MNKMMKMRMMTRTTNDAEEIILHMKISAAYDLRLLSLGFNRLFQRLMMAALLAISVTCFQVYLHFLRNIVIYMLAVLCHF